MERSFRRPRTEKELQELEAAGLWQAQARAKQIGESEQKITIEVIRHIHKVFFQHVNPDIAGRFRKAGEDIKKLKCTTPLPGSDVEKQMYVFWRELDTRLAQVPFLPKSSGKKTLRKALKNRNEVVIDIATWTQYKIASIHPFCEGNGRMARLMTNLILYRHKLQPTDIKYEGDNRAAYLDALCAIDKEYDFRRLKQLIAKGMVTSYQKLIAAQKKAIRKS